MRTLWVVAAIGLAACSESGYSLGFDVPLEYFGDVEEVRLHVLQPPSAIGFSCDDLALGIVSGPLVELSQVRELVVRYGREMAIGRLERGRTHLFLAHGFGVSDEPLVSGCLEATSIDDGAQLVLPMEPRVRVDLLGNLATVIGEPFADSVTAIVTDTRPEPVEVVGAAVQWSLVDSSGVVSSGHGVTGSDGALSVAPAPPDAAGPVVAEVRVRWTPGNPHRVHGFVRPHANVVTSSSTTVFDAKIGRFAAGDRFGLALLTHEGDPTPTIQVRFCGARGASISSWRCDQEVVSVPVGAPEPMKLALIPGRGDATDGVLVIAPNRWWKVYPGQAPVLVEVPIGHLPETVLPGGSCRTNDELVMSFHESDHRLVDRFGVERPFELGFDAPGRILASACAVTTAGEKERAYLYHAEFGEVFVLVVPERGRPSQVLWRVQPEGVAVAPDSSGSPGLLLGTQVSLDAFVITRVALELHGDGAVLTPVAMDMPPPPPPRWNRAGDIDGDDELDVVSLLVEHDPDRDVQRVSLWAAIAKRSSDERIHGASSLEEVVLCDHGDTFVWLADVDGDGDDDVVIVEGGGELCTPANRARVLVFEMGRPAQ